MRPIVRDDLAEFGRSLRGEFRRGQARLDKRIDRLAAQMVRMEARWDARFDKLVAHMDGKFDRVLAALEESLAQHKDQRRWNRLYEHRSNRLESRVDSLERRARRAPEA